MRRRLRVAALGLVAIAAAGGCAKPKPPGEVVFWHFRPAAALAPLLRGFERENPDVRVRDAQLAQVGGEDSILAAVATGLCPDLCELDSDSMPRHLASRALSDWSAGVADLRPTIRGWEVCSIGDAIYGLPWVLETEALYCNTALLARAGLDTTRLPETWEELYRAAAAIQRLGGRVHGYGLGTGDGRTLFDTFMPFAWGNGGEPLGARGDSVSCDSPAMREALEFCLRLRHVGTRGPRDALDGEFAAGRLGFVLGGATLSLRIAREAPRLRYAVVLVPRPAAAGGVHAALARGQVLVSFQRSKHKQDALRLARYLARSDNALALVVAEPTLLPATCGADTAAYYRAHPDLQVLVRQLATARFTPHPPMWGAMEAAIEEELEQALDDRKSVGEALAAAGARVADLLASH